MKHIKSINKIFESKDDIKTQQDLIEDIFIYEIDEKIFKVNKNEKRYFSLTCDFNEIDSFNDLNGLEKNLAELNKRSEIIDSLKDNIKKLENFKFEWAAKISEENQYLNLIIFYRQKDYVLSDAFVKDQDVLYIDDLTMKKVMREKYNLDYSWHKYETNIRNRKKFHLFFKGHISEEKFQMIQMDLSKIEKVKLSNGVEKKWTPFREYNIDYSNWDYSNSSQSSIKIGVDNK